MDPEAVERAIEALGAFPEGLPLLSRASRLAAGRSLDGEGRARLAAAVAEALRSYPPYADLGGGELLRYAETNLERDRIQARRDARNPHVRSMDRILAEARAAEASWEWSQRGPAAQVATIAQGALRFCVVFRRGTRGSWSQAWGGDDAATRGFLDHLDGRALLGLRVRTGLFPALDAAIGEITRSFLVERSPEELRVDGIDARRNAHNLATYGRHAPEGYVLEPVMGRGSGRATAEGVSGVRFVRVPDPAPRPSR
jgi:hypothetical protein